MPLLLGLNMLMLMTTLNSRSRNTICRQKKQQPENKIKIQYSYDKLSLIHNSYINLQRWANFLAKNRTHAKILVLN